jgi:hypothetical protein
MPTRWREPPASSSRRATLAAPPAVHESRAMLDQYIWGDRYSRTNNVRQAPLLARSGLAVKPSALSFSIRGEGKNGVTSMRLSPAVRLATVLMIF